MTFITFKFLHVAFMFMGVALAVGPALLVYLVTRSEEATATRRVVGLAERIFQISTLCYGLGIAAGFAAAVLGTLDLTAPWLVTAYVLVALLGADGVLFDRWTKDVARGLSGGDARLDRLSRDRRPAYLLGTMVTLVVAIIYVMVAKPSLF